MNAADPDAIVAYLKKFRRIHSIKTYTALFGGAMLCFVGPLLFTVFFTFFSSMLIASYGFWGTYGIVAAVTLPICFLMAHTLRGSVLEHWVPDGDSLSGRLMRRTIAPTLILLEVANIGPRLILWAIDRMRDQDRVRGATLDRIAICLAELSRTDGGISPASLLLPGEPADRLEPLLAFLLYHGMIDLSRQGDRVWLVSHVRRQLQGLIRR